MRLIKIEAEPSGIHQYMTSSINMPVPDGWALVPDDMELENCPWGVLTAKKVNGVMTVTTWVAGEIPEPEPQPEPEPTPPTPSPLAQMRADIDFISIMTGVEL